MSDGWYHRGVTSFGRLLALFVVVVLFSSSCDDDAHYFNWGYSSSSSSSSKSFLIPPVSARSFAMMTSPPSSSSSSSDADADAAAVMHRSYYDGSREKEKEDESPMTTKGDEEKIRRLDERRRTVYERITRRGEEKEAQMEEWRGAETETLKRLIELETKYSEAMRKFRENSEASSLDQVNRLGEEYRKASEAHFEELEKAKKMVDDVSDEKETLMPPSSPVPAAPVAPTPSPTPITQTHEVREENNNSRTNARINQYEDLWKNNLRTNEFPEEPLASNAYFPEFLPTLDAEMLCKEFINAANEEEQQQRRVGENGINIRTENIIEFPDTSEFGHWPTIGKIVEGSSIFAEKHIMSLYKRRKAGEPFKFKMRPAEVPADQFKFSKISNCPNRESIFACLFGTRPENEEQNINLCVKWTFPKSAGVISNDTSEEDRRHQFFSRQAALHPGTHAVLTGAIMNYMLPEIYVDEKFSRVKCSISNDIESGRRSGEVFFVSVHGRRGDSCNLFTPPKKYGSHQWEDPENRNLGRACYDTIHYKRALHVLIHKYYDQGGRGKFKSVTVLLASDSEEFIRDMLAESGNKELDADADESDYNYCWVDPLQANARDVYGTQKTYTKGQQWIEYREDLGDVTKGETASDLTLAEFDLLSKGYALVGGLHGHMTKALYFLISGRLGMPAPYVSLDGWGFVKRDVYLKMRDKITSPEDFGASWGYDVKKK